MEIEVLRKIGENIKRLRKLKGLTQSKMAQRMGLSVQYIGAIERGERSPSVRVLELIARTLEVKLKDLFEFNESVSKDKAIQELLQELERKNTESIVLLTEIAKKLE